MNGIQTLTGNSYAVIDLKKLKRNIEKVKGLMGETVKFLPVLKGSTCGHGLEEIAEFLVRECGLDMLCVGHVIEAERLRSHGITCDILVFGGSPFNNIPYVVEHGITTTLAGEEYARELSKAARGAGTQAKVHIKINTGLNRLGVEPGDELEALLREVKALPGLLVEGAYTHFATATERDTQFVRHQAALFEQALAQLKEAGFSLKYRHVANSVATIRFPEYHYDMVRNLVSMLGYDASPDGTAPLGLEEILCWKAFISQIRDVKAGERFGYYRAHLASHDMRIAISSFGYADGYPDDAASNGGYVIIRGKKAPILSLDMDQGYIDVTEIEDAAVNDEMLLLGGGGEQKITIMDIMEHTHVGGLYILSMIGQRVRRIYTK